MRLRRERTNLGALSLARQSFLRKAEDGYTKVPSGHRGDTGFIVDSHASFRYGVGEGDPAKGLFSFPSNHFPRPKNELPGKGSDFPKLRADKIFLEDFFPMSR